MQGCQRLLLIPKMKSRGCFMKFDGEQGVIQHFLMDVTARSRTEHTLLSYRHHLKALVRLLSDVCHITELEEVTILHLRQCVQYLLDSDVPRDHSRSPIDGKKFEVSTVRAYVRVWKAFF